MTNHLATGDFNHDGKTDVAIATSYTENSTSINNSKLLLYLQDKDNLKIADNTYDYDGKTYGSVASIVCGDINHDGLDDIVIGVRNEVGIYYQNANGKFSLPVYLYAGTTVDAIKIGDADNDGFNDIVVSCADLGRIVVFFGDVSGKLSNANYYLSKKSGGGDVLQIAKLSSDTQNSVVKMYGQGLIGSVTVYHFNKDRTADPINIINVPTDINPVSFVVGNVNSDNKKENEMVFSMTGKVTVWGGVWNLVNVFSLLTPDCTPGALAVGDMNNDGVQEILMISGDFIKIIDNKVISSYYLNDYSKNNAPDVFSVADLNSDGKLDIVSCSSLLDGGMSVMLNTTATVVDNTLHVGVIDQPMIAVPKVFPNPCVDVLNIDNTKEGEIVTIYDSTSRVIKKVKTTNNRTVVNTRGLLSELYIINVSGKNFKIIKK